MRTAVLTLGTFDLFHRAHVDLLDACAQMGDHVTVALNYDEFVEELKGHRPVLGYEDRLRVIAACRYVDLVIPGSGTCSGPAIEKWCELVPADHRLIVAGEDLAHVGYLERLHIDDDFLRNRGIRLVYVHNYKEIHSTDIRSRCKEI